MADPVVVLQQRAVVLDEFNKEAAALADTLGIDPPGAITPLAKQPDLRELRQLEATVEFLKRANASLKGTPKRAKQASADGKPGSVASPAKPATPPVK